MEFALDKVESNIFCIKCKVCKIAIGQRTIYHAFMNYQRFKQ